MPSGTSELPEWEQLLSAAAHLQQLFPEAVLVGGTAAAIHAGHRVSRDADHVLTNVRERFDDILAQRASGLRSDHRGRRPGHATNLIPALVPSIFESKSVLSN